MVYRPSRTSEEIQVPRPGGRRSHLGRIMRRALSTQVLKAADTWGPVCTWGVAANPAITAQSTDTEIASSVTSRWDAIAGAYAETSTNPDC